MKEASKVVWQARPCPDAAILVHEKVISLLRQEKKGVLLDAPAGEGAIALSARDLGYQVRCGDIDLSRFKGDGVECSQFDMNAPWPYPDCMFDHVVSIEGIEHLENPWHMVREANRVLRIGGKLLVSTPNILSIKSRLSYLLYGYPNYFHYMIAQNHRGQESFVDHVNPIGFLELRHILSRSGFEIETIDTNRYVKKHQLFYQLIRCVLYTRGRSTATKNKAKAAVREVLLSSPLLFGEILILKCRKERAGGPSENAE